MFQQILINRKITKSKMRVKFRKLNLSFDKDGIGRGFKEGGRDDGRGGAKK